MSGSEAEAGPSLQPFECLVCNRRFTRHENLKRHAILHRSAKDSTQIKCAYCTSTFARRDLRRRHVKRKHPKEKVSDDEDDDQLDKRKDPSTQDNNSNPLPDIDISGNSTTSNSTTTLPQYSFLANKTEPSPAFRFDFDSGNNTSSIWSPVDIDSIMAEIVSGSSSSGNNTGPFDVPNTTSISLSPPVPLLGAQKAIPSTPSGDPSPDIILKGLNLFYEYAGLHFNFIHQPTFNYETVPRALRLAILSIGLNFDQQTRGIAKDCYFRGKALLSDEESWKADLASSERALGIIQALLLFGVHAILIIGGDETQHGFRLHSKCVELARKGGLMDPLPPQQTTTTDLDELWRNAIRAETHKRVLFSIYHHDAVWYCILSRPRSLSHLEIKHDLPSDSALWTATSSAAWAHRSLTAGNNGTIRYIDAVRSSLSNSPISTALSSNPLGVLLVIMFHFTSIREVSGWSTMTGRTSFERFEALHTSLRYLDSAATGSRGLRETPLAAFTEATWHISMIELSLWSQPHTGGLVEGSLDAALAAATMLIAAHPVPIAPEIAEALEPHITWMLVYLNKTVDVMSEPPWMTVYLFKGALVALQVMGMGIHTSVSRIGITTTRQLLDWMREVFSRRSVWNVGRLMARSLDELEGSVS